MIVFPGRRRVHHGVRHPHAQHVAPQRQHEAIGSHDARDVPVDGALDVPVGGALDVVILLEGIHGTETRNRAVILQCGDDTAWITVRRVASFVFSDPIACIVYSVAPFTRFGAIA